jgi:hypothetical protein
VFANDTWNNSATLTYNFVIDITPPSVVNFTPNYTVFTGSPLLTAAYDEQLSLANITIDTTNYSATVAGKTISYQSSGLTNGTHSVTAYAFDLVGNRVMHAWNFVVDREGNLQGYVMDNAGSPVFNANISATQGSTIRYTVLTDPTGFYSISIVDEGAYNITITKPGMLAAGIQNLQINGTSELTRNFTLNTVPDYSISGVSASGNRVEGQTIVVNASVAFDGDNITQYTVALYANGVEQQRRNYTSVGNVTLNWTATPGSNVLTMGVLPKANESDLANNNATMLVSITPIEGAIQLSAVELWNSNFSNQISTTSQNNAFNVFMTITNNQTFTLQNINSTIGMPFAIINGTNPQLNSIGPGQTGYVTWLANATTTGTHSVNVTTVKIKKTATLTVTP